MSNFEKENQLLQAFTETFQSLMIASKTSEGQPYASYAPCVKFKNTYYFIISKVAKHYENLMVNPHLQIMFLEDESKAKHIFFRKRLSYDVNTSLTEDEDVKKAFITFFGDFAKQLFTMDFVMVKCHIQKGRFVFGPGKAFVVDDQQIIVSQITGNHGKGHQTNK